MPRESSLPPIFAEYAGTARFVQRVSDHEYSSSCPKCGGDVHADHTWPDRCRWFVDEKPLGWCRRCSALFFPDGAKSTMTPQAFQDWRVQQIEREEARKRSAERALAHLRSDRAWVRYYEARGMEGTRFWTWRGVPEAFQDIWQLGFCPGHSATIPLFDHDWQVLNIKHRLLSTNDAGMKYRYEITGQGQPPFLCLPDAALSGHMVAVEGEIKAMVMFSRLDDPNVVMVGLPGASPSAAVLAQIGAAETITLVMDPGAEEQAERIADKLGRERCRVLIPAGKVDDLILACDASKWDIRRWLQQARKVAA